ncbi:MAG: ATP-dependent 6-phosphofructokinase [Bacillota bacterium]|nr:ATP-dependent 6-phosphofructokinase [Bacillota bacterium]
MGEIKKLGIMTGGGDCSGLNAVIRAVVTTAINKYGMECVGIQNCYRGLYLGESQMVPLTLDNVDEIIGDGGTILYNSNKDNLFKYPRRDKNGIVKGANGKPLYDNVSGVAVENVKKAGIDALVIIGGDGTLTSGRDYSRMGIKVMGVPKTIDNDLNSTDQTFGFDTAVNRNVDAVDCLKTTGKSHHRVMVLEVMGREAGHLALHTGIAGGADAIIIPEIPYDIVKIKDRVKKALLSKKQYSLVVVAEGAPSPEGKSVISIVQDTSPDGVKLGGIGGIISKALEAMLNSERDENGYAISDTIMDVECRSSALSHVQRGGDTSAADRVLCTRYGSAAVNLLVEGYDKHMVALRNNEMVPVPLEEVIPSSNMSSNFKPVDPNGSLVKMAKTMGICFGD